MLPEYVKSGFTNILVNACQAITEQGKIIITTEYILTENLES